LRAKRFDTGHDVTHAWASWPVGLYQLGFLAVAALRLNALRNDDTSVADVVRRERHQVYGEPGRHRLDVSNETYEIIGGLVQDENELESPVAQRGTERLREFGGVDALFLRGLADHIEQAAPAEVSCQYLPLELLSRDAVQRSSVGKHLSHYRPPRLRVVP
jgi:hypothetical protein